ncbi:Putative fatty acyl-CoA reductase CG5065 [Eumeta japonica]|uniref:Fatty acyl-CoA reductase n=1 Tax=Eumeta variegata TaxID=151549 RepID=A0A4C1WDX6_EUMVA|nr:Putative fatty acyl-CoA reductase CG5065 [Eumeta japonica]
MTEDLELSLPDRIADAFSGKSIFLTGGTGFILERRCPDISNIYMLIRPKKGKSPKQRLLEIFNHDLFEQVRDIYTLDELASKVIPIDGDIASEGLNLSQESKDLCTKAEIIVHTAACIRFDADLKQSILMNTRGTKYVLDLAKEFQKLELFVYMSTAFCHPEEAVLEEKGYRPYYDPHEMIRTVEVSDEETLSALTSKVLKSLPNCYTLSKALAEALVEETSNNLPILIMRPSVVIPILYDPLPGWTDNLNGPAGLLIAERRCMQSHPPRFDETVPPKHLERGYISHVQDVQLFNLTKSHRSTPHVILRSLYHHMLHALLSPSRINFQF